MRRVILFVMVMLLSGCASSSGVVRTGQDTYMIARTQERLDGSSNNVKAAAFKEANRYCESFGKVMKVISTSQKDMIPFKSDATAEVHFMCLDANDPRLKQGDLGTIQQPTLDTKLKTLNKLLEDRLITKNEFDEQKKKLLDDYTSNKN